MAMQLQPLAQKVLNPELQAMVKDPTDPTGIMQVTHMSLVKSPSDVVPMITAVQAAFASGNLNSQSPVYMSLVSQVLAAMPATKLNTMSGLFYAGGEAGVVVFLLQFAQFFGQGEVDLTTGLKTLTASQTQYVIKVIVAVKDALQAALPFQRLQAGDQDHPTSVVTTLADHYSVATYITITTITAKVPQNVAEWLFPDGVIALLVFVGLGPWLKLRFLGTFVPGPWNMRQRTDSNFYDSRYAQLLAFRGMADVLRKLSALEAGSDGNTSNTLAQLSVSVTNALSAQANSEASGDAMVNMYGKVEEASRSARHGAAEVARMSSQLNQRTEVINSLLVNVMVQERRARRAKLVARLWILTTVVVIAVAVLLLVLDMPGAFLLHTGVVLAAIAMLGLVMVIRSRIQ